MNAFEGWYDATPRHFSIHPRQSQHVTYQLTLLGRGSSRFEPNNFPQKPFVLLLTLYNEEASTISS